MIGDYSAIFGQSQKKPQERMLLKFTAHTYLYVIHMEKVIYIVTIVKMG